MTSRTLLRGEKPATSDDSGSFRPTRLRSSLRRKVSSIFGKRPSSCHFEQQLLASGYEDAAFSASSHSLCPGTTQGGSPSLDAFLESIITGGAQSASELNHTESLSSLLRANNVCLNPAADVRAIDDRRPVSAKQPKEDGKLKDFRSYLKKVALKRKDKISSSLTNLSNRMRDRGLLLKRESSPMEGRYNSSDVARDDGSLLGHVPMRRNTHSVVEGQGGPFQRTNNFRWSCNIPSDVNFCSLTPPQDGRIAAVRETVYNSSSHLEPFRHIDSSSEDDYSSTGAGGSDIRRSGGYTCTAHSVPVQPFARSRSAIIQRNRRKAVSYQFEPTLDDFINELHEYQQPSAKLVEPQCNPNRFDVQYTNYPEYNRCDNVFCESEKPEDIYSNWDVYMAHKHSVNDNSHTENTDSIYDEGYEYVNFESLEDEFSDGESNRPDPTLLCEDQAVSGPEPTTIYNTEFPSLANNFASVSASGCDLRKLELFEQTILEEDDNFDEFNQNEVEMIDLQIVESDSDVPLTVMDIIAEEAICTTSTSNLTSQSSTEIYYENITRNIILFDELQIGKRFLYDRRINGTSLLDVRKLSYDSFAANCVYQSLGNVWLHCQQIESCAEPKTVVPQVCQANHCAKRRKRKRRNNKKHKYEPSISNVSPMAVHNGVGSSANITMVNTRPTPNDVTIGRYSNTNRSKRKRKKNRYRKKKRSQPPQNEDCQQSYLTEPTARSDHEESICDAKRVSKDYPSSRSLTEGINELPDKMPSDACRPSDFQLTFLNSLISPDCEPSSLSCTKNGSQMESDCDIVHTVLDAGAGDPVDNVRTLFDIKDGEQGMSWVLTEGEEYLCNLRLPANTLTGISKQVDDINELFKYAKDKVEQTLGLLQGDIAHPENTERCQEELTKALTNHLASFGEKLTLSKDNLEDTAKCYLLLDKAYEWALQAMKVVDALKATGVASPEQVSLAAKTVSTYLEENQPIPVDAFEAMIAIATKLDNSALLQQCKVAQARCGETLSLLKNRHAALLKTRRQVEFDWQSFVDLRELMGGVEEFSWLSNSTLNNSGRRKSVTSLSSRSREPLSRCSSLDTEDDLMFTDPQQTSTPCKQTLESRTSLGNIKELRESAEDLPGSACTSVKSATNSRHCTTPQSSSAPAFSSGSSSCSSSSESYLPVSGDGLLNKSHGWASSQVTEDCSDSLLEECISPLSTFTTKSYPPSTTNSHLLIRGSQINLSNTENLTDEEMKRNKTLLLIMQELMQTEKDYVNSLEYIIENYIPELMREDIPQALRGQRNVIFGNIEKIFQFHSNFFLIELESCHKRPFSVGSVFLKFEKQFYLYALYNKNKPKSDNLMSEYGTSFFKSKQIELGDKMDLSSYLLKPVQRMGKYALLLMQLLKECSRGEEDHEELTAAQEMVQFQLRHGNDLLAMDSLRDCDVNLKEQGRLLRQGELTVSEGNRKKSIRHVFLFEDLILFSKSRRDPERKNLEIFQYKCSMKMTDIGMTEQVGESTNKFEIWFRKRKPSDTYVLQATSIDLKESWTEVLSKVLWRQALKNRSLRLHEMSSMGIGNKPCLDIRPSEDQICERSVCLNQLGSARFKPTIPYMENPPSRRPHSVISVASSGSTGASSSNSSSTGPTFVGTLNLGFEPGDSPRPLTRSVTRTSQCSAESGIMADIYSDKDTPDRHYMVERSNSSVTTISGDSVLSPAQAVVPSSQVATSSTYVNVISHASESCQLVKDHSTGSLLTTEV